MNDAYRGAFARAVKADRKKQKAKQRRARKKNATALAEELAYWKARRAAERQWVEQRQRAADAGQADTPAG